MGFYDTEASIATQLTDTQSGGQARQQEQRTAYHILQRLLSQPLFFCLLIIISTSCRRNSVLDERFYSGEINERDLAGCWVISNTSMHVLKTKCGFPDDAKRSDHVLILNPDMTCVVRWYNFYYSNDESIRFNRAREMKLHGAFFEETFMPESQIPESRKSWYVWNPAGEPVISGPVSSNNFKADSEFIMKNRFCRWGIVDHKTQKNDGYNNRRYLLALYSSEDDTRDAMAVASSQNYRALGQVSGKIVLWAPVIRTVDYVNWKSSPDLIYYEKISIDEFTEIVRSEYPEPVGQAEKVENSNDAGN